MIRSVRFIALAIFVAPSVFALEIVSRDEWNAKEPKEIEYMPDDVPFVIIHHSYVPDACYTHVSYLDSMKSMQRHHQDDRKWADIGYTFGIGGNGKVYEGRGFNRVGAHAPKYNAKSLGIVLIGDWRTEVPSQDMLQATRDLIAHSIDNGHLSSNYTIYGHRQVRVTECPGDALFNEIRNWPNFGFDLEPLVNGSTVLPPTSEIPPTDPTDPTDTTDPKETTEKNLFAKAIAQLFSNNLLN